MISKSNQEEILKESKVKNIIKLNKRIKIEVTHKRLRTRERKSSITRGVLVLKLVAVYNHAVFLLWVWPLVPEEQQVKQAHQGDAQKP